MDPLVFYTVVHQIYITSHELGLSAALYRLNPSRGEIWDWYYFHYSRAESSKPLYSCLHGVTRAIFYINPGLVTLALI